MVLPLALVSGPYFILSIYYYLILSFLPLHPPQGESAMATEPAPATTTSNRTCRCRRRQHPPFVTRGLLTPWQAAASPRQHVLLVALMPFFQCLLQDTSRRVWDPGKVKVEAVNDAPAAAPFPRCASAEYEPTARSTESIRSLFHYCHPSLSRPTVPNI